MLSKGTTGSIVPDEAVGQQHGGIVILRKQMANEFLQLWKRFDAYQRTLRPIHLHLPLFLLTPQVLWVSEPVLLWHRHSQA